MNKCRFVVVFLLCPPLLGFLTGCGDSTKARVRGKVTLVGQPFYGTLFAINEASGGGDSCPIEKAGTYDMRNIPAGKVKFYVIPTGIPGLPKQIFETFVKEGVPDAICKLSDEEFKKNPFSTHLPPWARAADFPVFFESMNVVPDFTTPAKTPLEKTLPGGSSTVFNIDLKSLSGGMKRPAKN